MRNVTRLLLLADYLEKEIDERDFEMLSWRTCIAGHCCRRFTGEARGNIPATAQRLLGLTDKEANMLFVGGVTNTVPDAVRALRTLVYRGTFAG